ncbi:MAG: hypothetical protein ACI9G5_002482, partial [Paracoccaceae bacterium]
EWSSRRAISKPSQKPSQIVTEAQKHQAIKKANQ